MKKLSIIAIIAITVILASAVLTSNASAQGRAQWLWGNVTYYSGDSGVGSGKPVEIYFEPKPHARPPRVYTDANSQYLYTFYGPQYFYKVYCRFNEGGNWYRGQTIIDDTLYYDTQVDIIVKRE